MIAVPSSALCKVVYFDELERNKVRHRYIKFRSKGHYYIKCDETLYNQNGVLCVCGMKPVRSDHFKNWLKDNTHVCFPGIPCSQTSIDNSFKLYSNPEGDIQITAAILYNELAILTGKLNLSLNVLTSQEFYKLACKFIALGLCQYSVKGSHSHSMLLFRPISRDTLKQTMVDLAYKKHQEVLGCFSDQPYNCLALDAGTTFNVQYLHFVLENTLAGLPPYPCRSDILLGSKATHYVPVIRKGLYFLSVAKVKIGSIVIDGNTAQLKAFNPKWKHSIYHSTTLDNPKQIIIIPCLCHRCHNAYKYQAEHNGEILTIVSKLHTIASQYNQEKNLKDPICPTHCETRWAYDFYIVSFIINNIEKVKEILPDEDIPIENFSYLRDVLCIFKSLILTFESSHTKFSTAFTYLERGINGLYQLHYKHQNPYAYYLAQSLEKYTLKSSDGGLWSLAYSLTPNGRADFRKRNIQGFQIEDKNWLQYFSIIENSLGDDDAFDNLPENEDVVIEVHEPSVDTEFENESEPEEDESDLQDDDEYFVHLNTNFTDHLQAAKNKLKELLMLRGISEKDADELITDYNAYIESSIEIFSSLKTSKNDYSWIQNRNTFQAWKDMGDIAIRLLCSSLSEASCERTIKRQRYVLDSKRLRSTQQLLDARMILNSI